MWLSAPIRAAGEGYEAIERRRASLAAPARSHPHGRRCPLDYITEADGCVGDESRETHLVAGVRGRFQPLTPRYDHRFTHHLWKMAHHGLVGRPSHSSDALSHRVIHAGRIAPGELSMSPSPETYVALG